MDQATDAQTRSWKHSAHRAVPAVSMENEVHTRQNSGNHWGSRPGCKPTSASHWPSGVPAGIEPSLIVAGALGCVPATERHITASSAKYHNAIARRALGYGADYTCVQGRGVSGVMWLRLGGSRVCYWRPSKGGVATVSVHTLHVGNVPIHNSAYGAAPSTSKPEIPDAANCEAVRILPPYQCSCSGEEEDEKKKTRNKRREPHQKGTNEFVV